MIATALNIINPLTLPSLPLEEHRKLPNYPGIYFAIADDDEVIYIGRAVNLYQRWLSHHRCNQLKSIGNVKLAWLQCSDINQLIELEETFIDYFKPTLNGAEVIYPVRGTRFQFISEHSRKYGLFWKLREVMARKKVTNRELAHLLGVHETSISRLKASDTMPRIDGKTLERLCDALACTPDELLEYQPEA